MTPAPDVASGRYQQAEFAADLHQVWRDEAADEYGKPVEFFRRTFLTDGLRELLLNAARRFRGEGGDPIVELQTNFGGGKTHSLIALYHLPAATTASELPGVEAMLADARLEAPPAARTAVLVGQMLARRARRAVDGTRSHTCGGSWHGSSADRKVDDGGRCRPDSDESGVALSISYSVGTHRAWS